MCKVESLDTVVALCLIVGLWDCGTVGLFDCRIVYSGIYNHSDLSGLHSEHDATDFVFWKFTVYFFANRSPIYPNTLFLLLFSALRLHLYILFDIRIRQG